MLVMGGKRTLRGSTAWSRSLAGSGDHRIMLYVVKFITTILIGVKSVANADILILQKEKKVTLSSAFSVSWYSFNCRSRNVLKLSGKR